MSLTAVLEGLVKAAQGCQLGQDDLLHSFQQRLLKVVLQGGRGIALEAMDTTLHILRCTEYSHDSFDHVRAMIWAEALFILQAEADSSCASTTGAQ